MNRIPKDMMDAFMHCAVNDECIRENVWTIASLLTV